MIRSRISFLRSFSTHSLPVIRHQQRFHPSEIFKCNQTILRLSKLGRLKEARQVFDSTPQKDSVTWNSMISGYIENGCLKEANSLFNSFEVKNVRSWTIMLNGYFKYGFVDEARKVFESMPERNIVSWNSLVSGYVQNGDLRKAREMFNEMPERNVSSWNSMITGYCRCGMMKEAREMFDRMEDELKNSVTWMVLVSGYVEVKEYREAWGVFLMMLRSVTRPDQALLVVGLSAASGLNNLGLVLCLRTLVIKLGLEDDVVVGTAVLNSYTRNESLDEAIKFFELMPQKNEYTWTTMITAFSHCCKLNDAVALYERCGEKSVAIRTTMMSVYAQKGNIYEARRIFDEIVNPDVITWNAMISGYAQNGLLEEAKDLFLRMPDVVSWTAIISAYVRAGQGEDALKIFLDMLAVGIKPNYLTFTSLLSTCGNLAAAKLGCAQNGLGKEAVEIFEEMEAAGVPPDEISFLGVLGACSHAGLVDKGRAYFISMTQDHGIKPSVYHYTCMVDLLGGAGMLSEAEALIQNMPVEADSAIWDALLTAYTKRWDTEFEEALNLTVIGL
ncbi:hypothetical protein COLO4_11851 [Corchorus olitorius]|uniref:Pentacotripeptide-repeat region of PRORP domain-containing protein n=1 Tax=Corchorus olitorius TaxID=93759 RepID=A0A1R3K310_9ROSI|nr:hypothetical protein COLO4_11851 [Corchorus olitorius]